MKPYFLLAGKKSDLVQSCALNAAKNRGVSRQLSAAPVTWLVTAAHILVLLR